MDNKLVLLLLSSLGQKKIKRNKPDRGFTLIEVIVAIVILSIFILTALTALVAGLNLKLRAKLNNEATLLIQQDLETVRYQASFYGDMKTITGLPTSPATGLAIVTGTNLNLTIPIDNNGSNVSYALGEKLSISGEPSAYIATTAQINPTTSLAVTVDLSKLNTIKQTTLASSLTLTTTAISSITVTDASNILVGDRLVIGPATLATSVLVITVTGISVNTVSFAPFTPSTSTNLGTLVSILPRINDVISKTSTLTAFKDCTFDSTSTSSIASKFITDTPAVQSSTTSPNFNGRTYQLIRTTTASSDRRVELFYRVAEATNPTSCSADLTGSACLATLKTEVIPSVTFQCSK